MPTYEYACRECGQHLEVVQSFKDEALTTCGSCGGPLRKVFSAAGIIFKGSGYYVNDTRKAAAQAAKTSTDGKDAKKQDSGKAASSGSKSSGSESSGSESSGSESSGSKSSGSESSGTAESA